MAFNGERLQALILLFSHAEPDEHPVRRNDVLLRDASDSQCLFEHCAE